MQTDEYGQPVYLSEEDFRKRYWFDTLKMVSVINPSEEDFPFMVEMRHFIIKAGSTERFPGPIANVYLDQMAKIMAQNDDKFGHMSDPTLRAQYFDQLIADVEDLVQDYDPTPEYLKVPPKEEEKPFQEVKEEAAVAAPPAESNQEEEAEDREFELDGNRYKLKVAKNGRKLFYRNGGLIPVDEYNKAASML